MTEREAETAHEPMTCHGGLRSVLVTLLYGELS